MAPAFPLEGPLWRTTSRSRPTLTRVIRTSKQKLCKHFQDPHQMDRLMTRLFGPDGWTFDEVGELWIAPNPKGKGVYVVRRGGHWDLLEVVS
jgi:hypothetical protein